MQAASSGNGNLESAMAKLWGLSQESQTAIAFIIDRLADAEGVSTNADFKAPAENIGHWLTELDSNQQPSGWATLVRRGEIAVEKGTFLFLK